MPAVLFELIYGYLYLKGRGGGYPSLAAVGRLLGIDRVTARQRMWKAVRLGLLADPGFFPRKKDWCILTDRGAEAFTAICDGNEIAPIGKCTYLSTNRDLFPECVKYQTLSMSDYRRYFKALEDGYATPRESQSS